MNRLFKASLILFAITVTAPAQAESPVASPETPAAYSLMECYAMALKQSETIALQQELIAETEARFTRALGSALPHLSFSSSDKRQDGAGESAFTLRKIPERKFVLNQTLFSGFKELAAMKGAKVLGRQRRYEKERAEQLLLLDVANAYYLLQEYQQDLQTLADIHTAMLERVEELKSREQLGRSRSSEVASTQAQRLRLEAEMEAIRSRETVARQLLEFLTGHEPIEIKPDPEPGILTLEPLESYIAKTPKRPDIRAAEEQVEVSKLEKTAAQSELMPHVDVEGNYYTERAGVAKEVDWDVALKVEVPIFEGTDTIGSVQQAKSRVRQSEIQSSGVQRQATLEIRDAYAQLKSGTAQSTALLQAVDAADQNYRLQMEDYRLNLVDNLEVLQALQDLQNVRRDYVRTLHETKRLYWQFKVALGETS